jgi:hypothetical protein
MTDQSILVREVLPGGYWRERSWRQSEELVNG